MKAKYHGYEWKLQRLCDVSRVNDTALYFILYEHGEAVDCFKTFSALKRYIDALPAITD